MSNDRGKVLPDPNGILFSNGDILNVPDSLWWLFSTHGDGFDIRLLTNSLSRGRAGFS